MAYTVFGYATACNNDSEFRTAGSIISTQLSNHLLREPTTNDINWTTVTRPVTDNVYAGFEVYRFNDAAQLTHPIFFKFEYGRISNSYPILIRLTIAKACDAAGVLTDIILPGTVITTYSTSGNATVYNCYISSDERSLALMLTPEFIANANLFYVERAIDGSGNTLGNGLLVGYKANGASSLRANFCAYNLGTINALNPGGLFPAPLALTNGQSYANGTTTPYFPAACLAPNGLYWIPRIVLGGALVDCQLGNVVTNVLDGQNYMGIGNLGSYADQRNNPYSGMLMRWS